LKKENEWYISIVVDYGIFAHNKGEKIKGKHITYHRRRFGFREKHNEQ
jgi:hypothetical protein